MRKPAIFIGIMILSVLLVTTASAKSSDMFIGSLTKMIYEDCKYNNIVINQPYPYTIVNKTTNDSIDVINWPYTCLDLRVLIEQFSEMEPFMSYDTTSFSGMGLLPDGRKILTSQDNWLDINGDTYYWNGVRVDNIKQEFKITSIETHGNNSPVTTGAYSPINQQENNIWIQLSWPKIAVAGLIILVLKFIYTLFGKKRT